MTWQKFYERCIAEERKRWHKGSSLKDRAWYIGPFMVTTIFGRKGEDPYKTDVQLGSLALHIFWRGDADPDPHDHQHDFWTFPLVGYLEYVLGDQDEISLNEVKPYRLHARKAEYRHRVERRLDGKPMTEITFDVHKDGQTSIVKPLERRPIVTLVWRGRKRRDWGFWVRKEGAWEHVPWRAYIGRPT